MAILTREDHSPILQPHHAVLCPVQQVYLYVGVDVRRFLCPSCSAATIFGSGDHGPEASSVILISNLHGGPLFSFRLRRVKKEQHSPGPLHPDVLLPGSIPAGRCGPLVS